MSRWLKVAQWALTIASVALLAVTIDWRHIPDQLRAADLRYLALAQVIAASHFLVGAWRWQQLIQLLEHRKVSLRYLFDLYLASFFVSSVIPGTITGDALRIYATQSVSGGSARSSAIILIERVLGLAVLFAIGGVALLLLPSSLQLPLRLPGQTFWVALLIGGVAVAGVLALRNRHVERVRAWILRVLQSLSALPGAIRRSPIRSGAVLLGTILYQLLSALIVYQAFLAVHVPLPLPFFLAIIPVVTMLLILPISVQGIGVREYLFVVLLAPLSLSREAIVASLSLTYLFGIPYILWGWLIFSRRTKELLANYGPVQ